MVNKKIIKIRKDLDKLDNKLLDIINKRKRLVDVVIKNKKFKKDIVDKKESQLYLRIFLKSQSNVRLIRGLH